MFRVYIKMDLWVNFFIFKYILLKKKSNSKVVTVPAGGGDME